LPHREVVGGFKATYPLSRLTSNRHLIRIALIAAVAVGITGSTYYSSNLQLSNSLRKVSAIIFLVVTALLAIHTVFLIREERNATSKLPPLYTLSVYRPAT
jgi:membrane protein YdbS with pleckstrin-like domain